MVNKQGADIARKQVFHTYLPACYCCMYVCVHIYCIKCPAGGSDRSASREEIVQALLVRSACQMRQAVDTDEFNKYTTYIWSRADIYIHQPVRSLQRAAGEAHRLTTLTSLTPGSPTSESYSTQYKYVCTYIYICTEYVLDMYWICSSCLACRTLALPGRLLIHPSPGGSAKRAADVHTMTGVATHLVYCMYTTLYARGRFAAWTRRVCLLLASQCLNRLCRG